MFTSYATGLARFWRAESNRDRVIHTQDESVKYPAVGTREFALGCRCEGLGRAALHAIPAGSFCPWTAVLDAASASQSTSQLGVR